eukprot:Filipodium_phascolosomae@DN3779_c0_g1_i1.p1
MIGYLIILLSLALVSASRHPYWNPNGTYQAGSKVVVDDQLWEAKWWSGKGVNPAAPAKHEYNKPWKLIDANYGKGGEGGGPPAASTATPPPPVTGGNWTEYQAGTPYNGGDEVISNQQVYKCKAAVSAWCGGAAAAYAPGTGSAWTMAWTHCPAGVCPAGGGSGGGGQVIHHTIKRSAINRKVAEVNSGPLMRLVKESMRTLDNDLVEQITPGNPSNPANVKVVEAFLTEEKFEFVFSWRNAAYTYTGFLKAIGKFPGFCMNYSDGRDGDAICRKSLAVMFAHFGQETGGHDKNVATPEWRQALVHVREMTWTEDKENGYAGECNPDTWQGKKWPCGKFPSGAFKSYFGRGAKQLSYNYNYGPFSEFIYGTVDTLLQEPAAVADTWLNFASAVFFYLFPQPPKPSMLFVMDGTWQPNARDISNGLVAGFGVSIQIINGGVE